MPLRGTKSSTTHQMPAPEKTKRPVQLPVEAERETSHLLATWAIQILCLKERTDDATTAD